MPPLAVVVLAHADAPQVRRLVSALPGVPVVLHCDGRTPERVFREMTAGLPSRVRTVRRVRTTVTSWSLVVAELEALREALSWTAAGHIAVLSGADYPLRPMDAIEEALGALDGRSWIHNVPFPVEDWGTPRHPDGGLWRLRYRYLTRNDQVRYALGRPLRLPWTRPVPPDLTPRGASQWKIFSRADATHLLRLTDERPDLVRFFSTTLVPDETYVASMLGSPDLMGADALPPCPSNPWYMDWQETGHPHWLTVTDFDRLREASGTRLFARKFRTADDAVLDLIDTSLLK